MRMKILLVSGIVTALVAGGIYFYNQPGAPTERDIPLATPPGVTLHNMTFLPVSPVLFPIRGQYRFGDSSGMTAYMTDQDTQAGISSCEGECQKAWPPVLAAVNATGFGDWSIVTRRDSTRQWAYRGKPLYTSDRDSHWGETKGDNAEGGWHVARPTWATERRMPPGVGLREVEEANGQVLVDDRGMALYLYSGSERSDKLSCSPAPCTHSFLPFEAPTAAFSIGDFTVVGRVDGIQQWAYRGKPLYVFSGDVRLGDANGKDVDRRYRLALLVRYFTPTEVVLRPDEKRGGIWTTPDGKTLYARELLRYTASGSHNARGGDPGVPQFGITLGLQGCDAECEKAHPPLKAPDTAQASGYWTVLTRSDGDRQWAYQGYALYGYVGDKKPGEMLNADNYDLLRFPDNILRAVFDPWGPGLYWRVATF